MAAPGEEDDEAHPGVRHAFAAAPDGGVGFYVHGGTRATARAAGGPRVPFGDLWRYKWRQRVDEGATGGRRLDAPPKPGPRGHHSLLALGARKLLLYGVRCARRAACATATRRTFDADRAAWSRLNATNAPIHRYRQSLVRDAETGVVYLFGGESYKPYMYHNAVDALRLPADLAAAAPAEAGAALGRRRRSRSPPRRAPRAAAAARDRGDGGGGGNLRGGATGCGTGNADAPGHATQARTRRSPGHVFAPNAMGDFLFNVFVGFGPRVLRAGGLDRMLLAPLLPFIAAERLARPSRRRFRKIGE